METGKNDSYKEKRKQYNKKYQEKLKAKLKKAEEIEENNEQIEEQTDETTDPNFFFQKTQTQKMKPQAQAQAQPVVLTMPKQSVTDQIKNQLIMSSITLIPMVFTMLLRRLSQPQKNSLQNQSETPYQVFQHLKF